MVALDHVAEPAVTGPGDSAHRRFVRLLAGRRWESALTVVGVAAAALAVWLTVNAGFLAYPGWLAAQKADFILGPILVGLYWRHRRPHNRLGLLLIALGLIGVPYILESATNPVLFGVGVAWEVPIYVMEFVVIIAFPSGRIEGWGAWVILGLAGVAAAATLVLQFTIPGITAGGSISGCRAACPRNGLAFWSPLAQTEELFDLVKALLLAIPLATAALLVWRFFTGTPPRRRALAVGGSIAFVFLVTVAAYRLTLYVNPDFALSDQTPNDTVQWAIAVGRSTIWYGFLFALIAAELYAGRVLRRLVRSSWEHPSLHELEPLLREPLGDPSLRLGFRSPDGGHWAAADGGALQPPGPNQAQTEVDRGGQRAAVIVHDGQLSDDPELLQAAGAVALLALENAVLDAAWKESLRDLADSRARLVSAVDTERRRLERDLHDGAQQRFVAASIDLALAEDLIGHDPQLSERLSAARAEISEGLETLREVAHGIYPRTLARWGLARSLNALVARYPGNATVVQAISERFPPEIEAAIYYCCLEAVQNVSKHAGRNAEIWIHLYTTADRLVLEVRDNGRGFDIATVADSDGLDNMRDRLAAVGGHMQITSQPGRTHVLATVPLADPSPTHTTQQHQTPHIESIRELHLQHR